MVDKRRLGTFVLGGIAGVLAGIFFAPKSGKELRGSISSRANEARERGRETYFDTQERVQERIAETREGSPRREEAHPTRGNAAEPLPKLGALAPETMHRAEPSFETPAETPPEQPVPPLRDVSRDASPDVPASGEGADPEEIRQRIQQTRSRLRARLDASEKDRDG